MFSGIQEILLIALIVAAIFLIPRMTAPRRRPPRQISPHRTSSPSPALRLSIVLSIVWLAGWTLYLKPWQQDPARFAILGIGPVFAGWSLKWILAGKKKKR